jgi:hypothetical protein
MILRRLAQNLREQNWIGIAIQFVLPVAGVFFGIQVSNWNGERERGGEHLLRIESNLAADIAPMDEHQIFWKQVIAYGRSAIHYAETAEMPEASAWKTVLAFYQASQLYPDIPLDSTYQELRNSGDLGLIADSALRSALADDYVTGASTQVNFLLSFQSEYLRIVRGLTTETVSAHIWAHCHRAAVSTRQELLDCDAPVSEADAAALLASYLAKPELLPELRFWITNLDVSMGLIERNRIQAVELAAALDRSRTR